MLSTTNTTLTQLLAEPDLPILATVGEETYHALHLVVRRAPGATTAYCLERDWLATPAGQVGAYQQRIAELEAELERMRAKRSKRDRPKAPTAPVQPELALCPYLGCAVRKPAGRALTMHQVRVHGGIYRARGGEPTPDPQPAGARGGHAQPATNNGHRVAETEEA